MATKQVSPLLSYDEGAILGRGSLSFVYLGFFKDNSKTVAVKRIQNSESEIHSIQREVELMQRADDHPNILRYICTEKDDYFTFVVTELCHGTLEEYVKGKYQGPTFQNESDILFQVTQGLAHLHGLGIIHRDIKPNNILIYVPGDHGAKPLMKLADFGISKGLSNGREDFTNTSATNPSGTRGWMAPEAYEVERYDSKVDIFPLGCIFAYTLSGGKHPFGDDVNERIYRIIKKEGMMFVRDDLKRPHSEDEKAIKLIYNMLKMKPAERPTADDVLKDPFFQVVFNSRNPNIRPGNQPRLPTNTSETATRPSRVIDSGPIPQAMANGNQPVAMNAPPITTYPSRSIVPARKPPATAYSNHSLGMNQLYSARAHNLAAPGNLVPAEERFPRRVVDQSGVAKIVYGPAGPGFQQSAKRAPDASDY